MSADALRALVAGRLATHRQAAIAGLRPWAALKPETPTLMAIEVFVGDLTYTFPASIHFDAAGTGLPPDPFTTLPALMSEEEETGFIVCDLGPEGPQHALKRPTLNLRNSAPNEAPAQREALRRAVPPPRGGAIAPPLGTALSASTPDISGLSTDALEQPVLDGAAVEAEVIVPWLIDVATEAGLTEAAFGVEIGLHDHANPHVLTEPPGGLAAYEAAMAAAHQHARSEALALARAAKAKEMEGRKPTLMSRLFGADRGRLS
ncbi:MAG: hypothetical protein AAF092_08350 [Pseudomonadota bacterium]